MKKIFLLLFLIGFLLTSILRLNTALAQTDRCADPNAVKDMNPSELSGCIDNLTKAKNQSIAATAGVQKQVTGIKARISQIQNTIPVKEQQIADSEARLLKLMESLNDSIKKYYIKTQSVCVFCELLLSKSISEFTKIQTYQQISIDQDKALITNTATLVRDLQIQKKNLEAEKIALADVKTKLDKVVSEAQAYQSTLSSQIASLSARQQQILAQRLAGLNLPHSLGGGPLICTDDRKIDPGFGNAFAFFTFGIPHRVGMNQYGAWGRAKAGQSEEQILQAYFQNFEFQSGRENESVIVNGTNEFNQTFNNETMNIEEYLKHLHEMPTSWTDNNSAALKAQAIAARSYALRVYADKLADNDPNNNFLAPSQADQVIKREFNDSNWINAVTATNGKIMAADGKPIKGWFASTSGGYTFTSADVWGGTTSWTKRLRDTNGDVASFSDIQNKSYDKDSKCLYAAQGWRNEYGKSAWLRPNEVADIANTLLLVKADSSTREHLYQTDKSNPAGTDNWDSGRVKQELQNRNIPPYDNVSSISVSADFGSGITTSISFSGSRSDTFDGNEFKDRFNLRAPANLQIVGPLYNIETR